MTGASLISYGTLVASLIAAVLAALNYFREKRRAHNDIEIQDLRELRESFALFEKAVFGKDQPIADVVYACSKINGLISSVDDSELAKVVSTITNVRRGLVPEIPDTDRYFQLRDACLRRNWRFIHHNATRIW